MGWLPLSTSVVNTVVQQEDQVNGHWLLLHCPNCKTYEVDLNTRIREIDYFICSTCGEPIYYIDGRRKDMLASIISPIRVRREELRAAAAQAIEGIDNE